MLTLNTMKPDCISWIELKIFPRLAISYRSLILSPLHSYHYQWNPKHPSYVSTRLFCNFLAKCGAWSRQTKNQCVYDFHLCIFREADLRKQPWKNDVISQKWSSEKPEKTINKWRWRLYLIQKLSPKSWFGKL